MTLLAMLLMLPAAIAQAQTEAAPPPPPADAPPPAMAPPPPPPAMAPPPAVEAATKPPTAAEAMPATRPEVLPPIDVGAWSRVGAKFQKSNTDPKSLNDWQMDNAYVELHAGGKIHKMVGVTVNLNANLSPGTGPYAVSAASPGMNTPGNGSPLGLGGLVAIEDAIISFDIAEPFHIWAGRLLVPVDRANASGPFFMIPWNYPGFFSGVAAPKEGPSGRNTGAVVWGNIAGGKAKYLVGAFDNGNVDTSPLFSGRLTLALIGEEPGFWGNASYFGDKDILALGLGGQFQKHGSGPDKDWTDVNLDVLFEKKLGGGGWFTAEGAYYHYGVNDGAVSDAGYLLAAFATGAVGMGNLQPMARYQWEKVKGVDTKPWNLDIGLAHLIKGPALRVIATYSYTKIADGVSANSVQLGAQAIFF